MGCCSSGPKNVKSEQPVIIVSQYEPVTTASEPAATVQVAQPVEPTPQPKEEAQPEEVVANVSQLELVETKQPGAEGQQAPELAVQSRASLAQESALQDLLATRLTKNSSGETLRIQDVSAKMTDIAASNPRRPSSVSVTLDMYVEMHHKDFTALLEFDRHPGWTLKKTEESVSIYTLFDNSKGMQCFKGVTTMRLGERGLFYLLENLLDASMRPQWDDMCTHGEVWEQYLPFYRVSYFQFAPVVRNVLTERDLALITRFRFEADGTLLAPIVSTDSKPEVPGFVRANFLSGGYVIRKTAEEGLWSVSFMGAVDANGWIPTFIKNLVAWKQALVLAKFKSRYGL